MTTETFKLSELKKNDLLGKEGEVILKIIGGTPFKYFLKLILKDGNLDISEKGIFLNGKPYSTMMVGKAEREKMAKHGVQQIILKKEEVFVKMAGNQSFNIIMDY